jgi:hypothetical protein
MEMTGQHHTPAALLQGKTPVPIKQEVGCAPEPVSTFRRITFATGGRDGAVGTATRYGMDGPGIESRWRRDFPQLSRPALGPTQPPTQWVSGHSRG